MAKRNPFNLRETLTNVFTENTKVDKESNSIKGICMLRSESLNNRWYTPEALDSLVELAKEAPIKSFVDHDTFLQGQSVLKLLGEFSNLRRQEDAVYADLNVFKSSPGYGLLFELAESGRSNAAGFSINARGQFSDEPDPHGREVVERIVAIRSCDFVGEPATTHGLFETEDIWWEYADIEGIPKAYTTSYINDLPDAAFAWIEEGGSIDKEGSTIPRSLRHLPYKGKDGMAIPEMVGYAVESLDDVKNMTPEIRASVREKLECIQIELEKPVGEPYSADNPPAAVKNLPAGAQRIFIDVFNSTLKETGDETKARMAAWGAVKNTYTRDASGKWTKKTKDSLKVGGDKDMSIILNYFAKCIDKFEDLTDEAKESAAIEFVDKLAKSAARASELETVSKELLSEKENLLKDMSKLENELTEAKAKVDAYETAEKERKERSDRIELIAKITKEEELQDEHVSEEFKKILMEVQGKGEDTIEMRIKNLVKDRKMLLKAAGVTGMGDEQPPDGEKSKVEEKTQDKEDFFKTLNEGL
jgi:cation transport regulator ChaB